MPVRLLTRRSSSHPLLRRLFILLLIIGAIAYAARMWPRLRPAELSPFTEEEHALAGRLRSHVEWLAGHIGERNVWRADTLDQSADYIRDRLTAAGYAVRSVDYEVQGVTVRNMEAERPGSAQPQDILVIGAHYDSISGSPGANDNGSGVAALLELADLLKDESFPRTVRFVAFVNEEPPFFKTPEMGSRVYAAACRERGDQVIAMVSLETIGSYSDEKGSQEFPNLLLSFLYPNRGNFIGFVSNTGSRRLMQRALRVFRASTDFPAEGIAAPTQVPGVDWSDHGSFWAEGYPAFMVTDTALFRDPHYHTHDDTPEQLDYVRIARVTMGLREVMVDLAGGAP